VRKFTCLLFVIGYRLSVIRAEHQALADKQAEKRKDNKELKGTLQ